MTIPKNLGVLASKVSSTGAVPVTQVSDTANTSTGYLALPQGTTGQRSGSPVNGMIRYNTTNYSMEVYLRDSWFTLASNPNIASTVEIMLVAGGGTGGKNNGGGSGQGAGGGAGGLIYIPVFPVGTGSYTVTVGNGGASTSGTTAANGGNSVFTNASRTLTANGGGSGGWNNNTNNAQIGGCGGGQWYPAYTGAASNQPSTTNDGISTYTSTGFGNAGGNSGATDPYAAGGGGVGAAGGNFNGINGPVGGIGLAYSISGASTYYGGGGGGAGYSGNSPYNEYAGGAGGGGTGSNDSYSSISNGTANTGGGGGSGGSGGSGVVVIRYADTYASATSTTGSPTITVAGGYRIYSWTGNGSITF